VDREDPGAAGVKKCTTCGTERPLEEFAKSGLLDGRQTYKSRCKPCMNATMRAIRSDSTRVHFENVRQEESPHGKGIVKVAVKGWGYARNVRTLPPPQRGRRRDRAVPLWDQEAPDVVVSSEHRPEVLESNP
jgi:hypothetical protein